MTKISEPTKSEAIIYHQHCGCNVQEQDIIDGDNRMFTGSVLANTVRSSDQNDTHQESMFQHWPHILYSTMGNEKEGRGEGMLGERRGESDC